MDEALISQAFDYFLPPERIAQRPVHPNDHAKMLVIRRGLKELQDASFLELPEYLRAGDLVVFNDTQVIPARLVGSMEGREGRIEIVLVSRIGHGTWRCLGKPLKRFKPGGVLRFDKGLRARVLERVSQHEVSLEFSSPLGLDLDKVMREVGMMPIPPYIRKGCADQQDCIDYQSIFACKEGSIAAPTASLHFTPGLVAALQARGCKMAYVTLHVGTASFLPLWDQDEGAKVEVKPPASEGYSYSAELLAQVEDTRRRGGRVIAVGTTVVRALESMVRRKEGPPAEGAYMETDLFIYPGFEFRVVDALITNFHQPRTTHLLLVQAFMGRELLETSYRHALSGDYRFLSYGDGMLIE